MRKSILFLVLFFVLIGYTHTSISLGTNFIKRESISGSKEITNLNNCFLNTNLSKKYFSPFTPLSLVFDTINSKGTLTNSASDIVMQTTNGFSYTIDGQFFTSTGFVKFRKDNGRIVNWGSGDLPNGRATQIGEDTPSMPGLDTIFFNRQTGGANFETVVLTTYYQDSDNDGYGNNNVVLEAISQPVGYVAVGGDCDDTNNTVYPTAFEICFDGIDQNCDGNLNDGCPIITAQLRAENCGTTLTSIDQVVRGNRFSQPLPAGVLAMRYRFKITNLLTNAVRILERPNYIFQLTYTDFAEYNTPYSVEVEVRLNQEWMGAYGPACTILTPDVPNTVLASTSCGVTVSQMNNIIRAVVVPAAINYEYEVSLIEGGIAVETTTLIRSGESFNLLQLTGISIKYASEYRVRIKVQVLTPIGLLWSTQHGASCSVFSPPAPEAAIEGCGAEIGVTPASLTALIFATPHGGATQYRYRLSHVSGYDQVITTSSRYFRLNNFNALSPLMPGETYSLTVEVQIYGFYYPGKDCNILVPGGAPIVPFTRAILDSDNVMNELKAVAYPNPFNNSFALDLKTSSTNPVSIAIYDMTGRLLEIKEYKADSLAKQTIGERYPAGVYNVIVNQGENMQTLRVVKK